MKLLIPKPNINKCLPKYVFYIFAFYTLFLQYRGVEISNAVTLLGGLTLGIVLVYMLNSHYNIREVLTGEVQIILVFYFITFFTGIFSSPDSSVHINRWFESLLYFMLSICIIYITKKCARIENVVIFFCGFALLCAVTLLVDPVLYRDTSIVQNIRYSISTSLNVNTLGTYFTLGCWCLMFLLTFNDRLKYLAILYLGIMFLAINLTGSRKNLIAILIIVGLWFFLIKFRDNRKNLTNILITAIIAVVAFYFMFTKVFAGSTMALRIQELIQGLTTSAQDLKRVSMYIQGWDLFKQHPIFGVGFFGYAHYFGGYSHTTFIEVLCCTGIVGSALYFGMYIYSVKKIIKLIRFTNNIEELHEANKLLRMALIMWAELIFLAVGVIHIYLVVSFISFGILFSVISEAERIIGEYNYEE